MFHEALKSNFLADSDHDEYWIFDATMFVVEAAVVVVAMDDWPFDSVKFDAVMPYSKFVSVEYFPGLSSCSS